MCGFGEGNGNPLQYSLENLMDREPGRIQSTELSRVRHDLATKPLLCGFILNIVQPKHCIVSLL